MFAQPRIPALGPAQIPYPVLAVRKPSPGGNARERVGRSRVGLGKVDERGRLHALAGLVDDGLVLRGVADEHVPDPVAVAERPRRIPVQPADQRLRVHGLPVQKDLLELELLVERIPGAVVHECEGVVPDKGTAIEFRPSVDEKTRAAVLERGLAVGARTFLRKKLPHAESAHSECVEEVSLDGVVADEVRRTHAELVNAIAEAETDVGHVVDVEPVAGDPDDEEAEKRRQAQLSGPRGRKERLRRDLPPQVRKDVRPGLVHVEREDHGAGDPEERHVPERLGHEKVREDPEQEAGKLDPADVQNAACHAKDDEDPGEGHRVDVAEIERGLHFTDDGADDAGGVCDLLQDVDGIARPGHAVRVDERGEDAECGGNRQAAQALSADEVLPEARRLPEHPGHEKDVLESLADEVDQHHRDAQDEVAVGVDPEHHQERGGDAEAPPPPTAAEPLDHPDPDRGEEDGEEFGTHIEAFVACDGGQEHGRQAHEVRLGPVGREKHEEERQRQESHLEVDGPVQAAALVG